ncbi:hypothetical protein EI546_03345 [Aequorivita sp. H23M31]|uniref:Uncharacterized protein n=1 Tax=Aequorivita ciconiae TaxID=2494375 RepID=A0A410G0Q0_9FLAO|nr:hypothetical protein [Aequorivita sp. H23M31]QAA80821.1 hypothetical protein EI546_03345 [Aequorivita sp. H23M31]
MNELEIKLFEEVQDGYSLNPEQKVKLREACTRVVKDHPDESFPLLMKAAKIYLNAILEFPQLTL